MMSLRFDLGPTLKILNFSFLRFIERSEFENIVTNIYMSLRYILINNFRNSL